MIRISGARRNQCSESNKHERAGCYTDFMEIKEAVRRITVLGRSRIQSHGDKTVSEIIWLRWLLQELDFEQGNPRQLFCDNLAVKHIANNPVFHERTKHVEMDCYFVRERVESNDVEPLHINTKLKIADLFTKPLGSLQLHLLSGGPRIFFQWGPLFSLSKFFIIKS
ncbi:putative RNA-directed DNA polymerase [Helianthus annuus]|nr:putative RNA-directed DNA polymerase [Helianthus annuus]